MLLKRGFTTSYPSQPGGDDIRREPAARLAAKLRVKRLTLQFYQLPVKKGARYDYILIDKSLHKLVDRSVSVARPKDSNMQAITEPLR